MLTLPVSVPTVPSSHRHLHRQISAPTLLYPIPLILSVSSSATTDDQRTFIVRSVNRNLRFRTKILDKLAPACIAVALQRRQNSDSPVSPIMLDKLVGDSFLEVDWRRSYIILGHCSNFQVVCIRTQWRSLGSFKWQAVAGLAADCCLLIPFLDNGGLLAP